MAIAFDAFTALADAGADPSGSHTPVGTPKAVLVYVLANDGAAQTVSVTYGGVGMTALTEIGKTTGEPGRVYPFVLLSGVPTGAQTVTATCSGADGKSMAVYTFTSGGGNGEVVSQDTIASDALDDPSLSLSNASAKTVITCAAIISGKGADGNVTADANHTKDLADSGLGGTTGNSGITEHRTATTTSDPAVVGFTIGGAADDVIMHAVALAEASGGTPQNISITPATETDTAQALTFTKTIFKSLTAATETDAAQALSVTKTIFKDLVAALETDSAQVLSFSQGGGPQFISITPATETEAAVALSMMKQVSLVPAAGTEAAQALSLHKTLTIVAATESEAAQILSVVKSLALTPAEEADLAQPLTFTKTIFKTLTPAGETDTAVGLTFTGGAAEVISARYGPIIIGRF